MYPRAAPPRILSAQTLTAIGDALSKVCERAMDGMVLLGPLPRPVHDDGICWEDTAAFRLDRALCTLVRERLAAKGASFVQCGRTVCRRAYNGRKKRSCEVDISLFDRDRVHLNATGYAQVACRMPEGVQVGSTEQ